MFMNLHSLPTGKSMYTLGVTYDPPETEPDEFSYDEVDVVASSSADVAGVVEEARAELDSTYPGARVIGVINQSRGYVMVQDPRGDFR